MIAARKKLNEGAGTLMKEPETLVADIKESLSRH